MIKVVIVGRLGKDIEVRTTTNGTTVGRLRVASTDKWKTRDGEKKEHTEWVTCVWFGAGVEALAEWLTSGSTVAVEGTLRTREWEGESRERKNATEVRVTSLELLSSTKDRDAKRSGGGSKGTQSERELMLGDIPF